MDADFVFGGVDFTGLFGDAGVFVESFDAKEKKK